MTDGVTDPYECPSCRWQWRTRRLTLCRAHRQQLGPAPETGRVLDWIPATAQRPAPPAAAPEPRRRPEAHTGARSRPALSYEDQT
jgi:hypothetical protein